MHILEAEERDERHTIPCSQLFDQASIEVFFLLNKIRKDLLIFYSEI